jgi:protocatechuate 3,4-dioxygenase beta subunit
LKDIEPGRYRLSAERNGYLRQEYGMRGQNTSGTILSFTRGQRLTDVVFKLMPFAVIAGRIVNEDSEPLPGVRISVYKYAYHKGKRRLTPAGTGITNDLGEYRVFGLAPGRYVVSAISRPPTDLNLTVDRTAGEARPEEGYPATFFPGTMEASAATLLELSAGTRLQSINFGLIKTRTVRLRGRVTSTIAAPETTVTVFLIPKDSGLIGIRTVQVRDPKGAFEFRGVTPGIYTLSANLVQGDATYSALLKLDLAPGRDVSDANLQIGPGANLPGRIRVEGDAPASLNSVVVALEPRDLETSLSGIHARIHPDRKFLLSNVSTGDYDVNVLGLPEDVYIKSIMAGREELAGSVLNMNAGAAPESLGCCRSIALIRQLYP